MKKRYIYFLLLSFLQTTCTDTKECCVPNLSGINLDSPFFPTEDLGFYTIYDVVETNYALTSPTVVKKYQLKEQIQSNFTDSEGGKSVRIDRYRRNDALAEWKIDSVFTAKKIADKVTKTENNQTYVKLIFPFRENLKWDGNLYNNVGKDDYVLKNVYLPFKIDTKQFDNTVTVIQQNDSTLVDLKKRTEVYAKGVGVIFREKTSLFYCDKPECIGKAKIDFGTRYIQTINSYGKE
jgi:hypothetical protein